MSATKNLTSQRFGRLVATCPTKRRSKCGKIFWLCRCDCGNLTEVLGSSLLTGNTKSCGCLRKEIMANNKFDLKHGDAIKGRTARAYHTWRDMKDRCLNPNNSRYKYYGGRGISICIKWEKDYTVFKNWALDSGYANNLTIDRIDNNGNYEPSNCQWITKSENSTKAHRDRK